MRTLIVVLIILAFLESAILNIDLVLMVLILRAFVKEEKGNLYLALGFGLFLAHLKFQNLGLVPFIYLVLVQLSHILSKSRLSNNHWVVLPITLVMLVIQDIIFSVINHFSIQIWPKTLIEAILVIPVYLIIRFWEERFVIKPEIKLKIR